MKKPDLERYYDIPYWHNGRSFSGCNCFGLLWLWYRHELGIDLPVYDNGRHDNKTVGQVAGLIENMHQFFEPVSLADAGLHDVLYMTHDGDVHCGIVLDSHKFFHCLNKAGTAVSNIATWKPRIKGVYRHVNKAHSKHIRKGRPGRIHER